MQDQIDDGFCAGAVWVCLIFVEAFVQFVTDVFIHLATVPPVDHFSDEIKILEWVVLSIGLVPTDLG